MKYSFLILIIFIFVVGCDSSVHSDIDTTLNKTILIHNIEDSTNIDDIIEDYRLVPLSNRNDFLLSEIKQIVIFEDNIYVLSDGVFCFNMQGNPIFKIIDKGHKKSELGHVSSISVQDSTLYVYDDTKQVIHLYNYKTGVFIENIDVPVAENNIFRIKKCFLVDNFGFPSDFYDGKDRFLSCKGFKSQPDNAYLNEDLYKTLIEGQVTYNNTHILFSDYYNNKVFRIDDKGCYLAYTVKYENANTLSASLINEMVNNGETFTNDSKYQYGLVNVYENDNYIVGQSYQGIYCNFIHNKKANYSIAFKKYYSKIFHLFPYTFLGVYKDYFFCVFLPEEILAANEVYGFGDLLPSNNPNYKNQQVLMKFKENDNPIIALYKFK